MGTRLADRIRGLRPRGKRPLSLTTGLDVIGAVLVAGGVQQVLGTGAALIVSGLATLLASHNLAKGGTP